MLSRILTTGAAVTLIAPEWLAEQWWRRAVEGCSEWHLLSPTDGVYTHGSWSTPAPRPFWRTAVFRFKAIRPSATMAKSGSG